MSLYSVRGLTSFVAAGLLVCSVLVLPSMAQQNGQQPTPQQMVQTLLQNNPNGGGALTRAIRNLLLSDHSSLSAIMSALAGADPAQQSAIGTALGLVAQALVKTDQAFATQIQQAIAASGIQPAMTAFAAITPNTTTASAGGGGGGGGGGGTGGSPFGGAPFGGNNSGFGGVGGNNGFGTGYGNYLASSPSGTTAGSVSPF
jgi:hypothetical protein